MRILDAATSLSDLAGLNSNRLRQGRESVPEQVESLKENRKGQFSIRINDQWRVCFEWPGDERGPSNVEIVDYL